MKLETGKDYTMRSGEKARYLGEVDGFNVFWHYEDERPYIYKGLEFLGGSTDYDIIPEPKEIWVNEYDDGIVAHKSKESADKHSARLERQSCTLYIEYSAYEALLKRVEELEVKEKQHKNIE